MKNQDVTLYIYDILKYEKNKIFLRNKYSNNKY